MARWAIFVQRITAKWQSLDSERWRCRMATNWCTPLQALQSGMTARCNMTSTAKQLHKRCSLAAFPLHSGLEAVQRWPARFVRDIFQLIDTIFFYSLTWLINYADIYQHYSVLLTVTSFLFNITIFFILEGYIAVIIFYVKEFNSLSLIHRQKEGLWGGGREGSSHVTLD